MKSLRDEIPLRGDMEGGFHFTLRPKGAIFHLTLHPIHVIIPYDITFYTLEVL